MDLLLTANLFDVMEHIDDVAYTTRRFFNFRRQADATHGRRLHTMPQKRFRIVESLEKYLACRHCHLQIEMNEYFRLRTFILRIHFHSRSNTFGNRLQWQK